MRVSDASRRNVHTAKVGAAISLAALILWTSPALAIEVTPTTDADALVKQLLQGVGLTVKSQTYTGNSASGGKFTKGPLGLADGIILSSGTAKNAEPPNNLSDQGTNFQGPGDTLCQQLVPGFSTLDAARLDIKFSKSSKIKGICLDYVVGSEE